jgi:hypothetical protein
MYPWYRTDATGGRFFRFYPPDDSIESVGIPVPGDSFIEAVTFGCGITDTGWIYGGTGPTGLDPVHNGGGNLFGYGPQGFYSFGEMVDSMKLVKSLTSFYYSNHDTGVVFGGTGLDSAYTFIQIGADNLSRSPEVAQLVQGGSGAWVGGLCTVYPDTIYGCTANSTWVFEYIAPTDQCTQLGKLNNEGDVPLGAGPMVKQGGGDSLIYIAAVVQLVTQTEPPDTIQEPRFFEYDRTDETWNPGPASTPNRNPRYWALPNQDVARIRSLAVDSTDSHMVYIGGGGGLAGGGGDGHLFVFNPNQASKQSQQCSKSRSDRGERRGIALRCHPSPFTECLTLEYGLQDEFKCQAAIEIFDAAGRLVKRMPSGRTSGSVVWRGYDDLGDRVGPGVYFCRLTATGVAETRKVVLVR